MLAFRPTGFVVPADDRDHQLAGAERGFPGARWPDPPGRWGVHSGANQWPSDGHDPSQSRRERSHRDRVPAARVSWVPQPLDWWRKVFINKSFLFLPTVSQNSLCVTTKLAQVRVERENGCLGLTLRGGSEMPIIVTNVRAYGPAYKTSRIKPGDRVLRVDSVSDDKSRTFSRLWLPDSRFRSRSSTNHCRKHSKSWNAATTRRFAISRSNMKFRWCKPSSFHSDHFWSKSRDRWTNRWVWCWATSCHSRPTSTAMASHRRASSSRALSQQVFRIAAAHFRSAISSWQSTRPLSRTRRSLPTTCCSFSTPTAPKASHKSKFFPHMPF